MAVIFAILVNEGPYQHQAAAGHTFLAYIIDGEGSFPGEGEAGNTSASYGNETLLLFTDGDEIVVSGNNQGVRILLISGQPIGEPVAWKGPIVMNTQEELETAFQEYQDGTFIKKD